MTRVDMVQIQTLRSGEELDARCRQLGLDDLVLDRAVDSAGPLTRPLPLPLVGRAAANRSCILPTEGWDAERPAG